MSSAQSGKSIASSGSGKTRLNSSNELKSSSGSRVKKASSKNSSPSSGLASPAPSSPEPAPIDGGTNSTSPPLPVSGEPTAPSHHESFAEWLLSPSVKPLKSRNSKSDSKKGKKSGRQQLSLGPFTGGSTGGAPSKSSPGKKLSAKERSKALSPSSSSSSEKKKEKKKRLDNRGAPNAPSPGSGASQASDLIQPRRRSSDSKRKEKKEKQKEEKEKGKAKKKRETRETARGEETPPVEEERSHRRVVPVSADLNANAKLNVESGASESVSAKTLAPVSVSYGEAENAAVHAVPGLPGQPRRMSALMPATLADMHSASSSTGNNAKAVSAPQEQYSLRVNSAHRRVINENESSFSTMDNYSVVDSFQLNPHGQYSALEATMGDGFWEVGPRKLREMFEKGPEHAATCSLGDFSLRDDAIVLDRHSDERLFRMVTEVKKMCATSPYMQFHVQLIAIYCCAHMGGAQFDNTLGRVKGAGGVGAFAAEEKAAIREARAADLASATASKDDKDKQRAVTAAMQSNFYRVGELCYGTSRERALLFKYLADSVGVPSVLQRGELPHNDRHWNIVCIGRDEMVVDVMHHPGACYTYTSKTAKRYIESLNSPMSLKSYDSFSISPSVAAAATTAANTINNTSAAAHRDAFRTVQASSFSDQIGRNRFLEPVNLAGELTLVQRVGKGTYGQVYRASISGFTIAVKLLHTDQMSPLERDRVETEVSLLQMLNHPNIVKYLGRESREHSILILMEYVTHSLYEAVRRAERRERSVFSKREIVFVVTAICKGLSHLHKLDVPVIHRDLKSKNVLVEWKREAASGGGSQEEIFVAKLCDFGVAKELNDDTVANSYVGTCRWMAPEVAKVMVREFGQRKRKARAYDTKADIWSLGMCLYELLELKLPFYEEDQFSVHQRILSGTPPVVSPHVQHNEQLKGLLKLMYHCLQLQPKERPTAKSIVTLLVMEQI